MGETVSVKTGLSAQHCIRPQDKRAQSEVDILIYEA